MIDPNRLSTDLSVTSNKLPNPNRQPAASNPKEGAYDPKESFQASSLASIPVQTETSVPQATSKVTVFPQDPLVGPTEEIEIPKEIMGTRLSSPRMEIYDRAPVAIADTDGNYTSYAVDTPQFDQVNSYAIVANTLAMYDKYLGTPAKWSFRGPLTVVPHKGTGKTAYFSAMDGSINFFEWQSPSAGKRITTSQSADVISHEIGHAIWDGLRPRAGYSNEAGAFHEAFGDSSAMLHAMQTESNLAKALEQNGGDLTKPSLITRLAEEFGTAFNKEDQDPNNNDRPYYRTALNEFKYIDPKKLPSDDYPPTVGENVLTSEFHSFSRVWSGAMYRMLTSLYDGARADGKEPLDALKTARDELGFTWGKALQELPPSGIKYSVVAESMLRVASRDKDKAVFDRLGSVLVDRDILSADRVAELRNTKPANVALGDGNEGTVLSNLDHLYQLGDGFTADGQPEKLPDGRTVYQFSKPVTVQVGEFGGVPIKSDLYAGVSATFDSSGQIVSSFYRPVDEETIADAKLFTSNLEESGRVKESSFALASATHNDEGRVFLAQVQDSYDKPGEKILRRLPVYDY